MAMDFEENYDGSIQNQQTRHLCGSFHFDLLAGHGLYAVALFGQLPFARGGGQHC